MPYRKDENMKKTITDFFDDQMRMMKSMEDDVYERPTFYYQGILFGSISTLLYFDQINTEEAKQLAEEYVCEIFKMRGEQR